ncbi:MAG TPA: trimethylamine methyltransferase family protein, partial [Candidatus Limnocylindrales bacterium]
MTAEAVRRRTRRVGGGIPQLPFRTLTNPFRPLEVLSSDHVEEIHRTSLRILAEVGVEVLGDRAIELLAAAGATVDRANRRVRLDPALVEERIATAP